MIGSPDSSTTKRALFGLLFVAIILTSSACGTANQGGNPVGEDEMHRIEQQIEQAERRQWTKMNGVWVTTFNPVGVMDCVAVTLDWNSVTVDCDWD